LKAPTQLKLLQINDLQILVCQHLYKGDKICCKDTTSPCPAKFYFDEFEKNIKKRFCRRDELIRMP
jgi:hypothetical protein